jgi:hypothetical protein
VDGDTVAVKVTLAPTVGVEVDDVSVTVLTVEPVGACQKSPHPTENGKTAIAKTSKALPFLINLDIIGGVSPMRARQADGTHRRFTAGALRALQHHWRRPFDETPVRLLS